MFYVNNSNLNLLNTWNWMLLKVAVKWMVFMTVLHILKIWGISLYIYIWFKNTRVLNIINNVCKPLRIYNIPSVSESLCGIRTYMAVRLLVVEPFGHLISEWYDTDPPSETCICLASPDLWDRLLCRFYFFWAT